MKLKEQQGVQLMAAKKAPASRRGRPPKRRGPQPRPVDPVQLEKLAAMGCTLQAVATFFEFKSPTSIKTRIRREPWKSAWEHGRSRLMITLLEAQWRLALANNATMLIWLGKQYLGQTDAGPRAGAEESGFPGRRRRSG
jgi:hypothetical protein